MTMTKEQEQLLLGTARTLRALLSHLSEKFGPNQRDAADLKEGLDAVLAPYGPSNVEPLHKDNH